MNEKFKIGIDLGGTKIEIVAIDFNNKIIFKKRISTPRNYDQTVKEISTLVKEAEKKLKTICSVGLAIPGSISPFSQKVRNGNSTWLNGKHLQNDINLQLDRKVKISNDANCFTVSEAIDGSASKAESVFGYNGIAGEWGHNQMPWINNSKNQNRKCWCGLSNCIETFISGPSLEKEYFSINNEKLTLEEISINDIKGDINSTNIINILIERTAKCLAFVINLYDPEVIVLGGGVSNIARLYADVPKIWQNWIFSDECKTKLLKAKFGDSSGVRGAAWLHD